MKPQHTTVFVIREVKTNKLIKFGAKCGWVTIGAAKNAFALHMKNRYRDWDEDAKDLFGLQSSFIIEELK